MKTKKNRRCCKTALGILTGSVALLLGTTAWAGLGGSATPSFPTPINVGQTIEVHVDFRPVLDGGDELGNPDVVASGFGLIPSCKSTNYFSCLNSAANWDPEVFAAVGVEAVGSGACPDTFDISSPNPDHGEILFTPQSGDVVMKSGQTCTITLSMTVLKLPTLDAQTLTDGQQTSQAGTVHFEAVSQSSGLLTADAIGSDTTTVDACSVAIDKCVKVDIDGDGQFDDETCFGDAENPDLAELTGLGLVGKDTQWVLKWSATSTKETGGSVAGCHLTDVLDGNVEAPLFNDDVEPTGDTTIAGSCTETGTFVNFAEITCNICNGETVAAFSDDDSATLDCVDCNPQIDKSVTCSADPEGNLAELDPDLWVDVDGVDDTDNTVEGCIGWENKAEVAYRITPRNDSDPEDVYSVAAVECYLADAKTGLLETGLSYAPGETGSAFYSSVKECDTNNGWAEGENTASISCLCSTGLAEDDPRLEIIGPYFGTLTQLADAENPEITYDIPDDCAKGDSDTANLECKKASINIVKVCDTRTETGNAVHLKITNDGEAAVANCTVTDTLAGINNMPIASPVAGDLDGVVVNGEVPRDDILRPTSFNNTASVTCDVVGTDGQITKHVNDDSTDECEIPGEGCTTLTPGYWATHEDEAQAVLDQHGDGLFNCGIVIDTSSYGNGQTVGNQSTVQDMCSIGTDPAKFNCGLDGDTSDCQKIDPQLAQLTRQCMAAQLNLELNTLIPGNDCNSANLRDKDGNPVPVETGVVDAIHLCCGPIDESLISICNTPLASQDADWVEDVQACIGIVGGFNESVNGDEVSACDALNDPAVNAGVDCNAEPGACQDAKNDALMNMGRGGREQEFTLPTKPGKKK